MVLSTTYACAIPCILRSVCSVHRSNKRLLSFIRNWNYLSKSKSWVTLTPKYVNKENTNVNKYLCCTTSIFTQKQYCSSSKDDAKPLESLRPEEFIKFLNESGISRCFIVKPEEDAGKLLVSHPALEPLADKLAAGHFKFDNHDAIFLAPGSTTNCLLAVFLWKTHRGQGAGGVDLKQSGTMADFLAEGNRFSKNLGIKSALAGIWASGGKGLIAAPSGKLHLDPDFRRMVFRDFGEFLSSLNGCMVAGSGVHISVQDVNNMFTQTRYLTNLSETIGGTGNPAEYTGQGVVTAMEAAINFLNMRTLKGKTVVIQGAGFVGEVLISLLLSKGVRHIHVTECNKMRADDIRHRWSHIARGRLTVTKVSFEDQSVFKIPCDIMAPCARERVLNKTTIPMTDVKIVCGAANNPVDPDGDNHQLMMDHGITYVTDVVPNRMGMVSKMLEPYGRMLEDPEMNKHLSRDWEHSIYQTTQRILSLAQDENIPPFYAAFKLGELMSLQPHPIYPGRARHIIQGLIDTNWHHGEDFWRNVTSVSGAGFV